MARTKKVKSAGRLRAGYGIKAKAKLRNLENIQRKKQTCPFCKKLGVKRVSKGIWYCRKCGKKFASNIFYIE